MKTSLLTLRPPTHAACHAASQRQFDRFSPQAAVVAGRFVLTLGNAKDVMTDEQIKIVMWRIL